MYSLGPAAMGSQVRVSFDVRIVPLSPTATNWPEEEPATPLSPPPTSGGTSRSHDSPLVDLRNAPGCKPKNSPVATARSVTWPKASRPFKSENCQVIPSDECRTTVPDRTPFG